MPVPTRRLGAASPAPRRTLGSRRVVGGGGWGHHLTWARGREFWTQSRMCPSGHSRRTGTRVPSASSSQGSKDGRPGCGANLLSVQDLASVLSWSSDLIPSGAGEGTSLELSPRERVAGPGKWGHGCGFPEVLGRAGLGAWVGVSTTQCGPLSCEAPGSKESGASRL